MLEFKTTFMNELDTKIDTIILKKLWKNVESIETVYEKINDVNLEKIKKLEADLAIRKIIPEGNLVFHTFPHQLPLNST